MAIPDYQSIMLPLLKLAGDNHEHPIGEARDDLARTFELSEEEMSELLPSGMQRIFDNRVGWARTYLKKACLIEYTKRGVFRITQRGLDVLGRNPSEITSEFLGNFSEFISFRDASKRNREKEHSALEATEQGTPEESLEYGYQRIRQNLALDLIGRIKELSPAFFEKLVIELLVRMGYGGSIKDAGKAIGKSGDGGIDGIIKEDKLGLDIIYVQAKRWDGTVGRPEIQKFAGALQGHRAKKGIFITTSSFSNEALDYVSKIDSKIVLIEGVMLAQLMIDYDIGVSKVATYDLKKIDSDYFTEE